MKDQTGLPDSPHPPSVQTREGMPKHQRMIPKWEDLKPFIRARPMVWDGVERRLGNAESVDALRRVAQRTVPKAVFDYTDGAAGDELSLTRNREFLSRTVFRPRVLRDVSKVDTSASILGKRSALPLSLAPTGFTRLMNHEGETSVARSAQRAGVPYALSTMGTSSIEEVADAAPVGRKWFQLYLWKNRAASAELLKRAADSGYEALVLTVDTPIAGPRLRDVRNGFTIPPTLTAKTVADAARKPRWWFNLLTTEPLKFASLNSWSGTVAELANSMFDPSATLAEIEWLKDQWPGKLIVKGIQHPDDAASVVGAGADVIVISNHGGRQLDRAIVPLDAVDEVRAQVGNDVEIIVDGGISSGSDIAAALCLGADSVLIGRAYLYGLMAGGERGVDRVFELLREELESTMKLLGVTSIDGLDRSLIKTASG